MKRLLITLGGLAAAAGVAAAAGGGRRGASSPVATIYPLHPAGAFGPAWKTKRPPALPKSARPCSADGAARDAVRRLASAEGLGAGFVAFVDELGEGESGLCFGRPANNFDARLQAGYSKADAKRRRLVPDVNTKRPAGKDLITAWGVFQFNRDAWRSIVADLEVAGIDALAFPWECTPEEEIAIPIRWYARLWRIAKGRRLTDAQAGALCRIWHWSPAAYEAVLGVLRAGQAFGAAWLAHVDAERRAIIAGHITDAGLGRIAA